MTLKNKDFRRVIKANQFVGTQSQIELEKLSGETVKVETCALQNKKENRPGGREFRTSLTRLSLTFFLTPKRRRRQKSLGRLPLHLRSQLLS
jgi:hypothetical protein